MGGVRAAPTMNPSALRSPPAVGKRRPWPRRLPGDDRGYDPCAQGCATPVGQAEAAHQQAAAVGGAERLGGFGSRKSGRVG